jgi:hypothetical protein
MRSKEKQKGVCTQRSPVFLLACQDYHNFLKHETKHARRKPAQEPSPGRAIVYANKIPRI